MARLARLDIPGVLHHIMIRRIEWIAARAGVICELDPDDIFTKGNKQRKIKVRSLLCFWTVQELGISLTELAIHLGITVPGVGYGVERGRLSPEIIIIGLSNNFVSFLRASLLPLLIPERAAIQAKSPQ